ncbi:hypothetical protein [uncultured Methylobacterium sp.]|uniref:hypothetical protein n=1 Tax=uncultured Methylobacterium sp. TaxID=157278 RepID=UPI0026222052|nr:hypothetical protein [uncultured Methylobacterium sp.]
MTHDDSSARDRAETRQAQAQMRAAQGAEAMAEYRALAVAEDAKTVRLRALRLARDAAEAAAPKPAAAKPRRRG